MIGMGTIKGSGTSGSARVMRSDCDKKPLEIELSRDPNFGHLVTRIISAGSDDEMLSLKEILQSAPLSPDESSRISATEARESIQVHSPRAQELLIQSRCFKGLLPSSGQPFYKQHVIYRYFYRAWQFLWYLFVVIGPIGWISKAIQGLYAAYGAYTFSKTAVPHKAPSSIDHRLLTHVCFNKDPEKMALAMQRDSELLFYLLDFLKGEKDVPQSMIRELTETANWAADLDDAASYRAERREKALKIFDRVTDQMLKRIKELKAGESTLIPCSFNADISHDMKMGEIHHNIPYFLRIQKEEGEEGTYTLTLTSRDKSVSTGQIVDTLTKEKIAANVPFKGVKLEEFGSKAWLRALNLLRTPAAFSDPLEKEFGPIKKAFRGAASGKSREQSALADLFKPFAHKQVTPKNQKYHTAVQCSSVVSNLFALMHDDSTLSPDDGMVMAQRKLKLKAKTLFGFYNSIYTRIGESDGIRSYLVEGVRVVRRQTQFLFHKGFLPYQDFIDLNAELDIIDRELERATGKTRQHTIPKKINSKPAAVLAMPRGIRPVEKISEAASRFPEYAKKGSVHEMALGSGHAVQRSNPFTLPQASEIDEKNVVSHLKNVRHFLEQCKKEGNDNLLQKQGVEFASILPRINQFTGNGAPKLTGFWHELSPDEIEQSSSELIQIIRLISESARLTSTQFPDRIAAVLFFGRCIEYLAYMNPERSLLCHHINQYASKHLLNSFWRLIWPDNSARPIYEPRSQEEKELIIKAAGDDKLNLPNFTRHVRRDPKVEELRVDETRVFPFWKSKKAKGNKPGNIVPDYDPVRFNLDEQYVTVKDSKGKDIKDSNGRTKYFPTGRVKVYTIKKKVHLFLKDVLSTKHSFERYNKQPKERNQLSHIYEFCQVADTMIPSIDTPEGYQQLQLKWGRGLSNPLFAAMGYRAHVATGGSKGENYDTLIRGGCVSEESIAHSPEWSVKENFRNFLNTLRKAQCDQDNIKNENLGLAKNNVNSNNISNDELNAALKELSLPKGIDRDDLKLILKVLSNQTTVWEVEALFLKPHLMKISQVRNLILKMVFSGENFKTAFYTDRSQSEYLGKVIKEQFDSHIALAHADREHLFAALMFAQIGQTIHARQKGGVLAEGSLMIGVPLKELRKKEKMEAIPTFENELASLAGQALLNPIYKAGAHQIIMQYLFALSQKEHLSLEELHKMVVFNALLHSSKIEPDEYDPILMDQIHTNMLWWREAVEEAFKSESFKQKTLDEVFQIQGKPIPASKWTGSFPSFACDTFQVNLITGTVRILKSGCDYTPLSPEAIRLFEAAFPKVDMSQFRVQQFGTKHANIFEFYDALGIRHRIEEKEHKTSLYKMIDGKWYQWNPSGDLAPPDREQRFPQISEYLDEDNPFKMLTKESTKLPPIIFGAAQCFNPENPGHMVTFDEMGRPLFLVKFEYKTDKTMQAYEIKDLREPHRKEYTVNITNSENDPFIERLAGFEDPSFIFLWTKKKKLEEIEFVRYGLSFKKDESGRYMCTSKNLEEFYLDINPSEADHKGLFQAICLTHCRDSEKRKILLPRHGKAQYQIESIEDAVRLGNIPAMVISFLKGLVWKRNMAAEMASKIDPQNKKWVHNMHAASREYWEFDLSRREQRLNPKGDLRANALLDVIFYTIQEASVNDKTAPLRIDEYLARLDALPSSQFDQYRDKQNVEALIKKLLAQASNRSGTAIGMVLRMMIHLRQSMPEIAKESFAPHIANLFAEYVKKGKDVDAMARLRKEEEEYVQSCLEKHAPQLHEKFTPYFSGLEGRVTVTPSQPSSSKESGLIKIHDFATEIVKHFYTFRSETTRRDSVNISKTYFGLDFIELYKKITSSDTNPEEFDEIRWMLAIQPRNGDTCFELANYLRVVLEMKLENPDTEFPTLHEVDIVPCELKKIDDLNKDNLRKVKADATILQPHLAKLDQLVIDYHQKKQIARQASAEGSIDADLEQAHAALIVEKMAKVVQRGEELTEEHLSEIVPLTTESVNTIEIVEGTSPFLSVETIGSFFAEREAPKDGDLDLSSLEQHEDSSVAEAAKALKEDIAIAKQNHNGKLMQIKDRAAFNQLKEHVLKQKSVMEQEANTIQSELIAFLAGSSDPVKRYARESGLAKNCTWAELLQAFHRDDLESIAHKLPKGTNLDALRKEIVQYLKAGIEVNVGHHILVQMEAMERDDSTDCLIAGDKIFALCTAKRYFDVEKHPDLLGFEFKCQFKMRKQQLQMINDTVERANGLTHAATGSGKTTSLPMIAKKKATGNNLVTIKILDPLFEAAVGHLEEVLGDFFEKDVHRFRYRASNPLVQQITNEKGKTEEVSSFKVIYKTFLRVIKEKGAVITDRKSLPLLSQRFIKILLELSKKVHSREENDASFHLTDIEKDHLKYLAKIGRLLRTREESVIDEHDAFLGINEELHLREGQGISAPAFMHEVALEIFDELLDIESIDIEADVQGDHTPGERSDMIERAAYAYGEKMHAKLEESGVPQVQQALKRLGLQSSISKELLQQYFAGDVTPSATAQLPESEEFITYLDSWLHNIKELNRSCNDGSAQIAFNKQFVGNIEDLSANDILFQLKEDSNNYMVFALNFTADQVQKSDESDDVKEHFMDWLDRAALSKDLITTYLVVTMQHSNGKKFIRSEDGVHTIPTMYIGRASEGSEFDEIRERFCFTCMDFYQKGMSAEFMTDWMNKLRKEAQQEVELSRQKAREDESVKTLQLDETRAAKSFARIFPDLDLLTATPTQLSLLVSGDIPTFVKKWIADLKDEKVKLSDFEQLFPKRNLSDVNVDELIKEIQNNDALNFQFRKVAKIRTLTRRFLKYELSRLEISSERISFDMHNVVSQSAKAAGVSASKGCLKGFNRRFERSKAVTAGENGGMVLRFLSRSSESTLPLTYNPKKPNRVLSTLHTSGVSTQVVIDGAGALRRLPPKEVAEQMLKREKSTGSVSTISYFDLDGKENQVGEQKPHFHKEGFFYHGSQARGADKRLHRGLNSVLFTNGQSPLEEVLQNEGRLRDMYAKLQVAVPDNVSEIQSVGDVVRQGVIVEGKQNADLLFRSKKQEPRDVIHRAMLDKLEEIFATAETDDDYIAGLKQFTKFDTFDVLVSRQKHFQKYLEGAGNYWQINSQIQKEDQSPAEVLHTIYDKYRKIARDAGLAASVVADLAQLEEGVKKPEIVQSMPKKVLDGESNPFGGTAVVEVEVAVESQVTVQTEVETEVNIEANYDPNNHTYSNHIHAKLEDPPRGKIPFGIFSFRDIAPFFDGHLFFTSNWYKDSITGNTKDNNNAKRVPHDTRQKSLTNIVVNTLPESLYHPCYMGKPASRFQFAITVIDQLDTKSSHTALYRGEGRKYTAAEGLFSRTISNDPAHTNFVYDTRTRRAIYDPYNQAEHIRQGSEATVLKTPETPIPSPQETYLSRVHARAKNAPAAMRDRLVQAEKAEMSKKYKNEKMEHIERTLEANKEREVPFEPLFRRSVVQLRFFDGQLDNYTPAEIEKLREWILENDLSGESACSAEAMIAYLKEKVFRHRAEEFDLNWEGSIMQRVFAEILAKREEG